MEQKTITYVHDGKEVFLTGRIAKNNKNLMVEVLPIGSNIDDKTYAKWVNREELMIIYDLEDGIDDDTDE